MITLLKSGGKQNKEILWTRKVMTYFSFIKRAIRELKRLFPAWKEEVIFELRLMVAKLEW